jgi:hypothetical protein
MTTRTKQLAGLASAIVFGALAATLAVQPTPLYAADECLSGPKGAAPKGSHWHYRVDRATRKNCWYVRAEGKQRPSTSSAAAPALPQVETPLQPSVANARAEAGPVSSGPSGGAPEPAPFAAPGSVADEGAAAAGDGQSTVASRWLDQPSEIPNASGPAPAASDATANSAAQPATASPAAAEIRSAASSATFPPLLLVILGALAIAAGVTGVIVRFRAAGRDEADDFRREPEAPWDVTETGATIRSPLLASEAAITQNQPARARHEAVIPDEVMRLLSTLSKEAPA